MGFLFRKKKTDLKAKGSKVIYGKLLKFVILIVIYIYVYGYISAAWEEAPSLTLSMPDTQTEQSRPIVDRGEYLSITGTATAVDYVDIIFIPPRGNEGNGVNCEKGISHFRVSVHNDKYSLQLRICEKADHGVWYVLVLSVGKDGQYGGLEGTDLITLLQKLRNKPYDSSQIFAIIEDNTWGKVGSDDLMACMTFKINGGKNMHINPINTLEVGEELKVSGTISSPDAEVTIRITGPVDFPERSVQVRDGKFQAIFDTTDLLPGTYTVIAESENAYDTKSFEIIPAASIPSPTTVQTPRATPTQTPKATSVPASVVSPTPTKNQAHVQYVPQQVVSPTPTPQTSALSNYLYLIPIALLLILSLLILYIKREEKLREQKRKKEIERKSLFRKKKIEGKTAEEWFELGLKEINPKKKIEYFSKCVELDPDPKDAYAWGRKGFALEMLGRYEEAIRCYDKALEIDPEYEEARNNKKLAEEKLKGYYRAKIEQWKSEGYNVSELEEMLK